MFPSPFKTFRIRRSDWNMIKNNSIKTSFLKSTGSIQSIHWAKHVVMSESTLTRSPIHLTITLRTTSVKHNSTNYRAFNLTFSDIGRYPIPAMSFNARFCLFRIDFADFFVLEFPFSSDNNRSSSVSDSDSNSGSSKKTNKKNDLHDLFYDDEVDDRTKLSLVSDFLSHKISLDSSDSRKFASCFKTTSGNHTHAIYIWFANALHSNSNSNNNSSNNSNNEHVGYHNIASRIPPTTIDAILKSQEPTHLGIPIQLVSILFAVFIITIEMLLLRLSLDMRS